MLGYHHKHTQTAQTYTHAENPKHIQSNTRVHMASDREPRGAYHPEVNREEG